MDEEPEEIFEKERKVKMQISRPLFLIGYKCNSDEKDIVKKDLSIEILCNIIFGESSKLYQKLYDRGLINAELEYEFEYARSYAHLIIQGSSDEPEKVINEIKNEIEYYKNRGIPEEDFERIKKKIYGEYVRNWNDVQSIGNSTLSNYIKGINPFDFFEEFECISKEYVEQVLKDVFKEERKVVSIVECS